MDEISPRLGYGYEEGTPCQGFGCCGSVTNDAVSIYQSVSSDFDNKQDEKDKLSREKRKTKQNNDEI